MMLSPENIAWFYDIVLRKEGLNHAVSQTDIRIAIQNMVDAYRPNPSRWNEPLGRVPNYNEPAHRCAYLHKYAPLHTCLVQDVFHKALTECYVLKTILFSKGDRFNICSLGGGPGTDVVGIISACQPFGLLPCFASVVDLMFGWKNTFDSIVGEFRMGLYGNLSLNFYPEYFDYSYVAADLLRPMDSEVCMSIGSADLITMVKFLSAATCKETEGMIKKIFSDMRPGAMALFIDNDAGGFKEIVTRSAEKFELVSIYGPLDHQHYRKPQLNLDRYGYISCYETKVSVQMFIKPRFTFPNQSLNNLSPHLTTDTAYTEDRRRIPDSQLSKSSFSSKCLKSPLPETAPFYQKGSACNPNDGSSAKRNPSHGTDTLRYSSVGHMTSAIRIQSNCNTSKINEDPNSTKIKNWTHRPVLLATPSKKSKESVTKKSEESVSETVTPYVKDKHLPALLATPPKEFSVTKKVTPDFNDRHLPALLVTFSKDSSVARKVTFDVNDRHLPALLATPSKESSVAKTVTPNVNDRHLIVLHASPSNTSSESPYKKIAGIVSNVNYTRQPTSHSSSKVSNKSVHQRIALKDNPTRESVLHVGPSRNKPFNYSLRPAVRMTPYPQVSKPSSSSKFLETTPLCQNRRVGIPNEGPAQSSTKSNRFHGTDTSRNSNIKLEVDQMPSAAGVQSSKDELFEISNQSRYFLRRRL